MQLKRFIWRKTFTPSSKISPEDFFKSFSKWIPNSPEVFVDIADYQHVDDGPIILLDGHYNDYALEKINGQWSFTGRFKRGLENDVSQNLSKSFSSFQKRSQEILENLKDHNLAFETQTQLEINDRLFSKDENKAWETLQAACKKLSEEFSLNAPARADKQDERDRMTIVFG